MIIEAELACSQDMNFGFGIFLRAVAGRVFFTMTIVCGLLFVLIAWHSVDCGSRAGVFIAGVFVGYGFRSRSA